MARAAKPLPPAVLDSPDEIEQRFYAALQHGDIDGLMSVWADDDDISCVHPGGSRVVGAQYIRAAFEAMFANGAVDARPERVRRLQTDGCAVHSVIEQVQVRTADGLQRAWVVATNVYVRALNGWRLVAHHASPGTRRDVPESAGSAAVLH